MSDMWTTAYWRDLGERVIWSTAGGAVAALGGDAVNLWEVNWQTVAGLALGAGLVSALKGLAAKGMGDRESAATLRTPRKRRYPLDSFNRPG